MPNESFKSSRKDLQDVASTAREAVKDLGSTASAYGTQAGQQVRALAQHAREEGSDQFEQLKGSLADTLDDVRQMVTARPLVSILLGVVVSVAILGLLRGFSSRDDD